MDTLLSMPHVPRPCSQPGFIHHLTWEAVFAIHEVVRVYEVRGQVKHRPLQSHSLVPSLDPFVDYIKGAQSGDSDAL